MNYCADHHRAYQSEHSECMQCCWERLEREKEERKAAKQKKVHIIPPMSEKKKEREAKLAKVRQKRKAEIKYCETCGKTGIPLSYSHIIPVAGNEELEDHPLNAILECMECHQEYENGGLEKKMKQKSWPKKLAVILKLKPSHWNKMQLKQAI